MAAPVVILGRSLVAHLSHSISDHIASIMSSRQATKKEIHDWIARRIGLSPNVYETLARQSAYNLILKVMILEIVRERYGLEKPAPVTIDAYLRAFDEAYSRIGWDVFRPSLLDFLATGCNHESADILQRMLSTLMSLRSQPADLIGRLYEELIPQEDRRKLGEFYTPRPIAAFMTHWVLAKPTWSLLDPACGSGGFLIEAMYRYLELGLSPQQAADLIHGFDYNPLAVTMASANTLLRAPDSVPHIDCIDFLKNPVEDLFDAIVCNPPYTRHHELPQDYKEEIGDIASQEANRRMSRLSSLYVHFFIHSLKTLTRGGRMAFITPNEFLDVEYGTELKEYLLESCRIRALIVFHESSLLFREAQTTACITLVEAGEPDGEVTIVKLESWPETSNGLWELIEGKRESLQGSRVIRVAQKLLDPSAKWTRIGEPTPVRSKLLIPLGEIARVKRGIATGANSFFVLSDKEVKQWGINQEYLHPVVTNARFVSCLDFTSEDFEFLRRQGMKVWLLDVSAPPEELRGDSVLEYFEFGKRSKVDQRYLTRTRTIWYSQEQRSAPAIIFPLMVRKNPRFIQNRATVLVTNNLHGVYPKDPALQQPDRLEALLAYLNSSFAHRSLPHVGRTYGGGLLKLEPKEVEALPVIDVRRLPPATIKQMATRFAELCAAVRAGRADSARKKIDALFERHMST